MEEDFLVYILLTNSGSLLSRCIKAYTKEPYSHVSIGLDENLDQLYSFGRLRPNNPMLGGFVREDVVNGTYGRFPETRCALYALRVDELQYRRIQKEINKFRNSEENYGYNFIGLLGYIVNKPIKRSKNYFCSQFVNSVLSRSQVYIIDKKAELTAPRDFRTCKDLDLVYEGYLQSYYHYKHSGSKG